MNHCKSRGRGVGVLVLAGMLLGAAAARGAEPATAAAPVNLAAAAKASASSVLEGYKVEKGNDGDASTDASRWVSARADGPHWFQLDLPAAVTIGSAHVHSGYGNDDPIANFRLEYWDGAAFKPIAGATVRDNARTAVALTFEKPVETAKVRLTSEDPGPLRLKELALWAPVEGGSPKLGTGVKMGGGGGGGGAGRATVVKAPATLPAKHYVFVNQCGYTLGWPKRFTAPVSPDGTKFAVTAANDATALFEGTITRGVGDFTAFNPADAKGEFVVRVRGFNLPEATSDPFAIEPRLLQRIALEPNARFMQDARSVVGTHASAYGGGAFRDSTYYTFEVPSLVLMYLSDPAFFDALPVEIDGAAERQRVLDPAFKLASKEPHDNTALATARRYFNELDPPVGDKVPDIIRTIHWGVGYYLLDPEQHDPSKDPLGNKVHAQTIEQFAFVLYGHPAYKRFISDKFYEQVRDFAFERWEKVGLFDVDMTIGNFKGRHAPGHSIMPNLMMHAVATREKRPAAEAARFLDAAVAQAAWVVEKLSPADPLVTKGQRMSEHKLITGLVMLLREHPSRAPAGLRAWLSNWADVMIARSDNVWDFRKYNFDQWTLPKRSPGVDAGVTGGAGWNEPGNLAGFPACAVAVASVLEDAPRARRLVEIGVAQVDNLFGRNPAGAHTSHKATEYRGMDRAWPQKFPDNTCARLERVRGTINSSASDEHYPFNPQAAFRHPEGWTAFNASFNVGLAYLNWYEQGRTGAPAGYGLFGAAAGGAGGGGERR